MHSNKQSLAEWLDLLWGNEPGKVFLPYKANPTSFDVPPGQLWPDKRNNIVEYLLAASASGKNVYNTVAKFDIKAPSKHKQYVIGSRFLFCDFDGNADEARAVLNATPALPRPSAVLSSGLPGHEHWYWFLGRQEATQDFEPVNKKLAYFLDADTGCWNADRVLRPPFTVNYMDAPKYKGLDLEPSPVDFIERNDEAYTLSDFDCLPTVKDSIVENITMGDVPPIGDVLAKYKWDNQHLDIFKNPPLGKGGRSDSMVRVAYHCAENGMPDEAMFAVLDDMDTRIGKFTGRHDRERRLVDIITKARTKYPFQAMPEYPTGESIQLVYTANELLHSDFVFKWLVDDLVPEKGMCLITAEPGAGKSRISMQLAKAMATGTNFLTWPMQRALSVMYLSLEMPGAMLKHFTTQLLNNTDMTEEESNNFKLVPLGRAVDLTREEGFQFIEMLLEEHKPEVMFIDALGKLVLDELGEVQSKTIFNKLAELTERFNTTFFLIHHNRKPDLNGKKRPSLGDVYGSQYITAYSDLVMGLFVPESQAHVELITLKSRAVQEGDYLVLNGKEGFSFTMRTKGEAEEDDNEQFASKPKGFKV